MKQAALWWPSNSQTFFANPLKNRRLDKSVSKRDFMNASILCRVRALGLSLRLPSLDGAIAQDHDSPPSTDWSNATQERLPQPMAGAKSGKHKSKASTPNGRAKRLGPKAQPGCSERGPARLIATELLSWSIKPFQSLRPDRANMGKSRCALACGKWGKRHSVMARARHRRQGMNHIC